MTEKLPIEIGPPHDRCRHSATVENVRWTARDRHGWPIPDSFYIVLDGTLRLYDGELYDLYGSEAQSIAYGEACRIAAREADDNARERSDEMRWAEVRR